MYIKTLSWIADSRPTDDTKHIIDYRHPDDNRLMVQHNDRYYSFRTDDAEMTAEVRGGLLDVPGRIDDIPLNVLLYVRARGYQITDDGTTSDIIDADASSISEDVEVWV